MLDRDDYDHAVTLDNLEINDVRRNRQRANRTVRMVSYNSVMWKESQSLDRVEEPLNDA